MMLVLCAVGLSGCGQDAAGNRQVQTEKGDTGLAQDDKRTAEEQELYLITRMDSAEESIQLYRYRNGKEYRFSYTVDTVFRDKYQKRSTASAFYPGKAVYIGSVDDAGRLSEVTMADSVWQYDDIVRFSIDEEKGILRIADNNYRITEETRVFSDGDAEAFSSISQNDVLSVVGQDKDILSVRITTGHGELQLVNTELFEGSFLQLNTSIFAEITPDMTMELPEGEYLLTVASNGWGGSCEIQIVRGESLEVDLDTIKGDGPKFGTVQFVFDVEDALLSIDGQSVDYSEPVTLQYGKHSLKAACSGYTEVSKYLFVNSEEGIISISFAEEEEKQEEASEQEETSSEKSQNSENDSEQASDSEEHSSEQEDILNDYLTTLSDAIGSL